ncbi:hypothetical protein BH11ARM2_BH11ARM2_05460 [soil metagenome]
MRVAVLPFNAAEGTKPALGRQFSAFLAEQLREVEGAEINPVSYLTQIEQDGQARAAFVNMSEGPAPEEQIAELFNQTDMEMISDGFLEEKEGVFHLLQRFHKKDAGAPQEERLEFGPDEVFNGLHTALKNLAGAAEIALPERFSGETMEFGTDDPQAFLNLLEGYDSLIYVQQANGAVAQEFSPEGAFDALLGAIEKDPDFEAPYNVLVQLTRACTNFQISNFETIEKALVRAVGLLPKEWAAYFALGELHQAVNNLDQAANYFERAIQREPNDSGLYARLGLVQFQSGMPVNAERNLKKALEMEGPDKPSADLLAQVLNAQGRGHEIPAIYRAIIDGDPQNSASHAKYAMALMQNGKEEEGERAFENALEVLEDNTVIKRAYAPYLSQRKNDYDRAMDFYEDYLEHNEGDIGAQMEYVQTLESAGREFEVPAILKKVLALNPDPDTRANVNARLIELEQPKRAEAVEAAREKMEAGDFQGAIRDLKPLRNWLADYWKVWALLASAYNRTEQYADAEEASKRLLEIFPGCEPGYGELTNSLIEQGKADEALNIMGAVFQQNNSSLPLAINFGLAAAAAGERDLARNLAKQIREAIGENPELEQVLQKMER